MWQGAATKLARCHVLLLDGVRPIGVCITIRAVALASPPAPPLTEGMPMVEAAAWTEHLWVATTSEGGLWIAAVQGHAFLSALLLLAAPLACGQPMMGLPAPRSGHLAKVAEPNQIQPAMPLPPELLALCVEPLAVAMAVALSPSHMLLLQPVEPLLVVAALAASARTLRAMAPPDPVA